MIRFPRTSGEAAAMLAETPSVVRAGATDLQERRNLGIEDRPLVDLRDLSGLDGLEATEDGGLRIGALVTVQALAEAPAVRAGWPGLAQAAGGLATPQIRAQGTVGGNLLQQVRCWYYRTDAFFCLKKGGFACLARGGDNAMHSCFDLGPCVVPHPSTLAVALLALDATVEVEGAEDRSMKALLGNGTDPRRTHTLEPEALLTHVVLPPPTAGEQSAYLRTIQRSRSEWPLVEAFAAVQVQSGTIAAARLALGGVANRPIRLPAVEKALVGLSAGGDLSAALALAARGASPLPDTGYKVALLQPTLEDVLARALAGPGAVPPGGSP